MYKEKYKGIFANAQFKKNGSISIQKKDYAGSSSEVLLDSLKLYYYYTEDTPIITSALDVKIRNNYGYGGLSDLMTNKEKDFKVILNYGDVSIWEGYLICDLNEEEVSDMNLVSLTFSDYLKKLNSVEPSTNRGAGERVLLNELYKSCTEPIGFDASLIVNASINHIDSPSTAWYKSYIDKIYIEGDKIYKNNIEKENAYDLINETLKPFNAFFYRWNNNYYIERYNDLTRTQQWAKYDIKTLWPNGENITNQVNSINRNNGDFNWVNNNAIQGYVSGLNSLSIKLNEAQIRSLVFNDFDASTSGRIDGPSYYLFYERAWYLHTNTRNVTQGYNFNGITKYIQYETIAGYTGFEGLIYGIPFIFYEDVPVKLNIKYKKYVHQPAGVPFTVLKNRYAIMIGSGDHLGKYLILDANKDVSIGTTTPYVFTQEIKDADELKTGSYDFSDSLDLTKLKDSLPEKVQLRIWFLPSRFSTYTDEFFEGGATPIRIGDFEVTTNPGKIDNNFYATIEGGFVNKKNIELDFFDLPDINYSSGFLYRHMPDTDFAKTYSWIETDTSTGLAEILTDSIFRKGQLTTNTIRGNILYDGYLKPLTLLSDNEIKRDGTPIQFYVTNYSWDPVSGIYNINADEYYNVKNNIS